MSISWEKDAQIKFDQMIQKIPAVLRGIAQSKVAKKAEKLAVQDNHPEVQEKDMIDAFFCETPFGFHGPMKMDMESLQIDYTQYGYDK
jgi:hypothetical protein